MPGLEIGLQGLDVAQKAIEIIGTNIANVSTDGYHRQTPVIRPVEGAATQQFSVGSAQITHTARSIDLLLENELLRQRPVQGQVSQELTTLQSVEASLGTLSSQGLMNSINQFFQSLHQLAAQPDSRPLQEQAVWAAEGMAGEFRRLGELLDGLQSQIEQQAQTAIGQVNDLSTRIASLNGQINLSLTRGQDANLLLDQRDQAITELADLVDVEVQGPRQASGNVTVSAWGVPLVVNQHVTELDAGVGEDNRLTVSAKDGAPLQGNLSGGQIGGLLALRNDLIEGLRSDLDELAGQIISEINRVQTQGVGSAGSFTELTGQAVSSQPLSSWMGPIAPGSQLYVRVVQTSTGQATRYAIAVNGTDTLADIASRLDGLDELRATADTGRLRIEAESGYQFDFLPAPTAGPASSTIPGDPQPAVSGFYSGSTNETYTATVLDSGTVGQADPLRIEVKNSAGQTVKTLSVGQGYAAGDPLELDQGIRLALPARALTAGQQFTIQALADSDPTGLLAACGVNTLFTGDSAGNIAVQQEVLADSGRIATAQGAERADNQAILKMAELDSTALDELGGKAPGEFYELLVTSLGQKIALRQARQDSLTSMIQQLANQQSQISGVDVNQESAKLLLFEQMYQAMAHYIGTIDKSLQALLDLL